MSTMVVTPPAAAARVAVLKPSLKLNTTFDKNKPTFKNINTIKSNQWVRPGSLM